MDIEHMMQKKRISKSLFNFIWTIPQNICARTILFLRLDSKLYKKITFIMEILENQIYRTKAVTFFLFL